MLNMLLLLLAISQPDPDPELTKHRDEQLMWAHNPAFLGLFLEPTFRYTGGGYVDRPFRYRLFVPETAGPEDKRPLLVWLHGRGEAGEDNIGHLIYLGTYVLPKPWERNRYPFFVLAVQCPGVNSFWFPGPPDADDMVNVLMAILEQTITDHPIDLDRICVSGVSSGGNGCWELALRHSDVFSAIAPMASSGADNSRIGRIAKLPAWAFHSARDHRPPVDLVRRTVRALQRAGGTAHVTEVDSSSHNCWTVAFEEYGLLDWLLSQKRGEAVGHAISREPHVRKMPPPPGPVGGGAHQLLAGWTPWQILAQVGIPLLVIIAIWNARRIRHQRVARMRDGEIA